MANRKIAKIIREDYPSNYKGYTFITLIQFNDERYLSIVDRLTDKHISAYLLDLCGPKGISEEDVLLVAYEWSISPRSTFPISYEFQRLNLTEFTSQLHRTFNVDFVERVIGPLPDVEMVKATVKRKKRKIIPPNIQVNIK